MSMNDPYSVLGVASSATDEEISKAYKKLARQYHPDLNPGNTAAEAKMKEINTAYEAIKDIRSGRRSYTGTDSSYSSRARGYQTYGNAGPGYTAPFEEYRSTYGRRYYGFGFGNMSGSSDDDDRQYYRTFGFFDILKAVIRTVLLLGFLRFAFSIFFFPIF